MTAPTDLHALARGFVSHPVARVEPLGQGLINDTFLVSTNVERFVLQRINSTVFPEPPKILANLRVLADHARRMSNRGECRLRLPELLRTQTGDDYLVDAAGGFWRALEFIDGARSLAKLRDLRDGAEVGRALGHFHALVADLAADGLHDTLPGFHIATGYLARFDAVLAKATANLDSGRMGEAVDFVAARRPLAAVLEDAKNAGRLPVRVIHGDPKLDNVLFDENTGSAVSLIDLDTVKPGLIHYDVGDCLRSCCNRAGESGQDAGFDLDLCREVLRGYWEAARDCLTAADREHFYDAIRLLPFELGLRFLTDHLEGDVYFKVDAPGRNLQRALVQFRLVASIEAQEKAIRAIIDGLPA